MTIKAGITDAIFDLDGTLIDSSAGIISAFRKALDELGGSETAIVDPYRLIGPPLRQSFRTLLGTEDSSVIAEAVEAYHRHFSSGGLHTSDLYPGVRALLHSLRAQGIRIHLATAKEEHYPPLILSRLTIGHLFTSIYGASRDGTVTQKAHIIQRLLEREGLLRGSSVMIGDRAEDIEGGREQGLQTIGVSYGFGSIEEIVRADPNAIAHSALEIASLIQQTVER